MDRKYPEMGPSIYRSKEATPFTELTPETLLKRGFHFLANMPNDGSIPDRTVVDFELAKIKKDLESGGLPSDEESRVVISDLATLLKGSMQVGYEVKLIKGKYEVASRQLVETDDTVAAFQRFQLDTFLASQTHEQLKQNGFSFVGNFPLHCWGDNLEDAHPDLIELLHAENQKITDYIKLEEKKGNRVQFIKGHFYDDADKIDTRAQAIAIFVKRK